MKRRLILFAKRPRRGRVKTRLVPPLLEEEALALYRAFLLDQIRFLHSLSGHYVVELSLDGPWEIATGVDTPAGDLETTEQGPGDLGQRLLSAFRRSRQEGAEATVVIGADSPTLPADHVRQAFQSLADGAAAVIAPADDGGYVLLGMTEPLPELFREIPWSASAVYEITRRRAADRGVSLVELPAWYDVDDASSLSRLRRELERPEAAQRAPATTRCLLGLT